jgi:hypothetical protein
MQQILDAQRDSYKKSVDLLGSVRDEASKTFAALGIPDSSVLPRKSLAERSQEQTASLPKPLFVICAQFQDASSIYELELDVQVRNSMNILFIYTG